MTKKTQAFYFDEAGFTGNNLLDPEQPVFVYAGVAMDEERASQLHADAVSRFQLSTQELKGANLIKHERGRKAISWILAETSQYCHLMVANKEYALACKFYEYIFEPVLADHSSLFYAIDFHKFVATILHIRSRAKDPYADDILRGFSEMMRTLDPEHLEVVLTPLDQLDQSNPIGNILAFACCHRKRIENELKLVRESGPVATWTLELSMTALHWLLASWGEQFEVLDVYCDQSKPIEAARQFFQIFIGREDKAYIRLGDQLSPSVVYNLLGPINMVDSKSSHGVQMADVLSSSLAYAMKNPDEEISNEWLSLLEDVPTNKIIPDVRQIDLTQERAFVNALVLRELLNRSIKGQSLSDNMQEFIFNARVLYPQYSQFNNLNISD